MRLRSKRQTVNLSGVGNELMNFESVLIILIHHWWLPEISTEVVANYISSMKISKVMYNLDYSNWYWRSITLHDWTAELIWHSGTEDSRGQMIEQRTEVRVHSKRNRRTGTDVATLFVVPAVPYCSIPEAVVNSYVGITTVNYSCFSWFQSPNLNVNLTDRRTITVPLTQVDSVDQTGMWLVDNVSWVGDYAISNSNRTPALIRLQQCNSLQMDWRALHCLKLTWVILKEKFLSLFNYGP